MSWLTVFARHFRSAYLAAPIALAIDLLCWIPQSALAAETASAVMLYHQVNPTTLRFNIDLKDTGTTSIGTLWYAWVPGEDFLGQAPTNIQSPSGWTANITHAGANDGFAVQWIAGSGAQFGAGQTLTGFSFDTSDTATQLSGNSPIFPSTPIGTTFIYSGQPFSDAGDQISVTPTAHPWQNPVSAVDVDSDGLLLSRDALQVIHALVVDGPHTLGVPGLSNAPAFIDVNGDGILNDRDALEVIHALVVGAGAVQPNSVHSDARSMGLVAIANVPEPTSGSLALVGAMLLALLAAARRPTAATTQT